MEIKVLDEFCRDAVRRIALAVAKGDGWVVSNTRYNFSKVVQMTFNPEPSDLEAINQELYAKLENKWHILHRHIKGEDEFELFYLDSYGDKRVERLLKKAVVVLNEQRDADDDDATSDHAIDILSDILNSIFN